MKSCADASSPARSGTKRWIFCTCPSGTAFACAEYGEVTCGGYGAPRAYVRVVVEDPYESTSGFSLLPNAMVKREAIMRVR